ncbi:15945_t:CDS:2, partial [Acaulospora morrowiae]
KIKEMRKDESHDGVFDLIVDSAGGEQVPLLLELLKPAGRFVFFGETRGPPKGIPNWRSIYLKSLTIMGTLFGSPSEFRSMMDFIEKHELEPIIDSIVPFNCIMEQFKKMEQEKQIGKLVVSF